MDELMICVAPYPGEKQEEKFPGKMDAPKKSSVPTRQALHCPSPRFGMKNGLQTTDLQWFERTSIRSLRPVNYL